MIKEHSDLKFTSSIPRDDYNDEIEVEATSSGILIEGYVTIPWDWVLRAYERFRQESPDTSLPPSPDP